MRFPAFFFTVTLCAGLSSGCGGGPVSTPSATGFVAYDEVVTALDACGLTAERRETLIPRYIPSTYIYGPAESAPLTADEMQSTLADVLRLAEEALVGTAASDSHAAEKLLSLTVAPVGEPCLQSFAVRGQLIVLAHALLHEQCVADGRLPEECALTSSLGVMITSFIMTHELAPALWDVVVTVSDASGDDSDRVVQAAVQGHILLQDVEGFMADYVVSAATISEALAQADFHVDAMDQGTAGFVRLNPQTEASRTARLEGLLTETQILVRLMRGASAVAHSVIDPLL